MFEDVPTEKTQMLSGKALLVLAQLACHGAVKDMMSPELSFNDMLFNYAQITSDLYSGEPPKIAEWAVRYIKTLISWGGLCTGVGLGVGLWGGRGFIYR